MVWWMQIWRIEILSPTEIRKLDIESKILSDIVSTRNMDAEEITTITRSCHLKKTITIAKSYTCAKRSTAKPNLARVSSTQAPLISLSHLFLDYPHDWHSII
mmetsp:Transcript_24401/g.51139  ORF Transcript_24401/g.51139 Transcript_24401/m.51139 type:complete len:102 (+) Transcript_24401:1981-2286(+)